MVTAALRQPLAHGRKATRILFTPFRWLWKAILFLTSPFRRLQFKLTMSYVVVTVITMTAILAIAAGGLYNWLMNTDTLPAQVQQAALWEANTRSPVSQAMTQYPE